MFDGRSSTNENKNLPRIHMILLNALESVAVNVRLECEARGTREANLLLEPAAPVDSEAHRAPQQLWVICAW